MIPYTVGKLAPNSSHLTRGLVKNVSGRSYFCTVPSQNGDKMVTSPPAPIVERVGRSRRRHCSSLHFLSSSSPDAGKYAVPLTTPTDSRLLLKSGRDVSPAGWVLSTKRKAFVACVRKHPSVEERLTRWKARLADMRVQPITLGEVIGREGSYFLNKKQAEQRIFSFEDPTRIFSFEDPTLSLTRGHILGEKLPPSRYHPHPSDVSSLEDTQERHLADFDKIMTAPLPPSSSTPPRMG